MMNTLIGTLVRSLIPPYYMAWEDVPSEDKAKILPRVEAFFDIGRNEHDWSSVNIGLDKYCASRYSSAKCKFHKHFKDHGGAEHVNNARRNPPAGLRPAWWNQLIDDIFLNPQWQRRSRKNSVNRSKLPYNSFHGSRSYVNTRFKKMNPETKKMPSAIENWHDMHYKKTSGWENEQAKDDYEKLVAEKEAQIQQASSSSNPNGSSSLNEKEIFKKVFSKRQGHNIGLGRKLKRHSNLPSSSTTSTPISNEMVQDMIRAAQEAWEQHREEEDRKRYQELATYISSIIPNANATNMPQFVSTPASPFNYLAYKENQKSQQSSGNEEDNSSSNEENSSGNEEDNFDNDDE